NRSPATGGFLRDTQATKFGQSVADFEVGFDAATVLEPGLGSRVNLLGGCTGQPAQPQQPPSQDDLAELLLLGFSQEVIDYAGVIVEILEVQMPREAK